MVKKKIVVQHPSGLHLKPTGEFAKTAEKCQSDVRILTEDKIINAKSLLNMLSGGLKKGTEIELICEGDTEKEDLKALMEVIETKF